MRAFERQQGESAKAYAAFSIYRDLGAERSLVKAVDAYYGSTSNLRQFSTWSSCFDWVARVRAYDDHNEMICREAVEQYERSRATDLASRVEALREENLKNEESASRIETKLLKRAEKLIDELPLVRETTVSEGEDGKPAIYKLEPATKNAVADVERLHKIATRSEPSKVDMTDSSSGRNGVDGFLL